MEVATTTHLECNGKLEMGRPPSSSINCIDACGARNLMERGHFHTVESKSNILVKVGGEL